MIADQVGHLLPTYDVMLNGIESRLRERLDANDPAFVEIECPVTHRFTPGIYIRTITMPAGSFIMGAVHRTEHENVLMCGKAQVMIDGIIETLEGPKMFVSKAGIRKVLFIHRDCVWFTVHPNPDDCRDVDELERRFIENPDTLQKNQLEGGY